MLLSQAGSQEVRLSQKIDCKTPGWQISNQKDWNQLVPSCQIQQVPVENKDKSREYLQSRSQEVGRLNNRRNGHLNQVWRSLEKMWLRNLLAKHQPVSLWILRIMAGLLTATTRRATRPVEARDRIGKASQSRGEYNFKIFMMLQISRRYNKSAWIEPRTWTASLGNVLPLKCLIQDRGLQSLVAAHLPVIEFKMFQEQIKRDLGSGCLNKSRNHLNQVHNHTSTHH